jgi:AI-2E family transporter
VPRSRGCGIDPEGGRFRWRPWLGACAATAIALLARLGFSQQNLTDRLRDAATGIASQSASFAAAGFSATASTLLGFFFALLAMQATLRFWDRAVAKLEAVAPLRAEHTRALLVSFRRAGRATLLGTVVTGAAQGALAAVGYWVTGVPEPVFFGIATAIASVVPVVGTLLVWVPAGLYLLLSGHVAWGIAELAWGLLVVVGFSDYVIRPRLVGDEDMLEALDRGSPEAPGARQQLRRAQGAGDGARVPRGEDGRLGANEHVAAQDRAAEARRQRRKCPEGAPGLIDGGPRVRGGTDAVSRASWHQCIRRRHCRRTGPDRASPPR